MSPTKRMLKLQVIVWSADKFGRKSITESLFSLYEERGISGATAWRGVKGYGSRAASGASFSGIATKLPIIIESVDEPGKIEPLLGSVKEIVDGMGPITLEEVNVI